MSLKQNTERWKKKLKLDAHYTMERFGIATAAFALTLTLIGGGTVATAITNNIEQTAQTALYTPRFSTSKTDLSGQVDGVYLSQDRTRSLVLMNFGANAAQSISAEASNYQAYLTGSDTSLRQRPLASDISGEIVVFGTSGYIGVVLDSDQPFEQQILNLTLRANSELVYREGDSSSLRSDLRDDTSFQEHDQWRVFVNPGAGKATKTTAFAGADKDFLSADAYYELVVKPQEEVARKRLDEALARMQVDLAKIDEYTAQMATTEVGGVKLVPPTVPKQIAGDKVTGTKGINGPAGKDDTGSKNPLTLYSDWTLARGYDFDWRNGSIHDGYLDALVPEGKTYVTFLAEKAAVAQKESSSAFNTSGLQWKLTDGSDLMKDYRNVDKAMKPLLEIMNNLMQAYQTYYRDKLTYQTSLLESLINLEISLKNVDSSSTVNSGGNALLTY